MKTIQPEKGFLMGLQNQKNCPEKVQGFKLRKGSGMEVYSVKDLSKQLHASQKAIRNYLKTGRLRGKKVFRKWLITEDALRELLGVGVQKHISKD